MQTNTLNIQSVLSSSWRFYKSHFWKLALSITIFAIVYGIISLPGLLGYGIQMLVDEENPLGLIATIGNIWSLLFKILVAPYLTGGLFLYIVTKYRSETFAASWMFSTVTSTYWRIMGTFISMILFSLLWAGIAWAMAAIIVLLLNCSQALSIIGDMVVIFFGVYLVALLMLSFALPLVVDKNLGVFEALKISRKASFKHLHKIIILLLIAGLFGLLGLIGLLVGIVFTLPLFFAVYVTIYEKLFSHIPTRS